MFQYAAISAVSLIDYPLLLNYIEYLMKLRFIFDIMCGHLAA